MRLDQKVVELLNCSKTYAQSLIKSNKVFVDKKCITKNGFEITNQTVSVVDDNEYVSRGAYKLLDAINSFKIDVSNKICADIGASTGGFSDVLLKQNAKKVYAIDVGTNQLHPSLLNHPRLVNYEKVNCRYIKKEDFEDLFEFVCMDVSFISIQLILPAVVKCCAENTELVVLIKPQFEVGKAYLNKHGIVKNEKIVEEMLCNMKHFFHLINLKIVHIKKCALVGKDGNQEYLAYLKVGETCYSD